MNCGPIMKKLSTVVAWFAGVGLVIAWSAQIGLATDTVSDVVQVPSPHAKSSSRGAGFPTTGYAGGGTVWYALPTLSLARHQVPACDRGRVNVFIRFENHVDRAIDFAGAYTGRVSHSVLTRPWIESSLMRTLTKAGYCVYFSPIWATDKKGHPTDQLDPSLAFSPNETSPKLEDEPPYVMVGISSNSDGYRPATTCVKHQAQMEDCEKIESFSVTIRNRWLSITPTIQYYTLLQYGQTDTIDAESLALNIEWVANRIPAVKTKLLFEGKELPTAPACQLPPPPTPDEIKATDLNWEKSADAACNVSSVYFDREGHMGRCADRKR
jgi:hypothetical protein